MGMSKAYKMELIKQSFEKMQIHDFDIMLSEEDGFVRFIDAICDAMQTYHDNNGEKPQQERQPKHFEDDGAYAD
jgi:hypothetical protein